MCNIIFMGFYLWTCSRRLCQTHSHITVLCLSYKLPDTNTFLLVFTDLTDFTISVELRWCHVNAIEQFPVLITLYISFNIPTPHFKIAFCLSTRENKNVAYAQA